MYAYRSLHLGSHRKNEMHHTCDSTFPFFSKNIIALSYITWEREIEELLHPFHVRYSKYYELALCISSFVGYPRKWWDYRKFRVEEGRKTMIQDWYELRACGRRTFIPPSFNLNHEIEKKKIELTRKNE